MDEGWTRWLFDNFGFDYKDVTNADLQAGNLKQKFDVIIFPDQTAASITNGFRKGSMPEEYTGGIGDNGIEAVKQFADSGGTVLCFNHSTAFCTDDLGAQATNVLSGRVANAAGDYQGGMGGNATPGPGGAEGGRRGGRQSGAANTGRAEMPISTLPDRC